MTYFLVEVNKLQDLITDIKELHISNTRDNVTYCTNCVEPDGDDYQLYPCETIKRINEG